MLLVFVSLISATFIVTSVDGNDNVECLAMNPCNFRCALHSVETEKTMNLTLVVTGSPVSHYRDLTNFGALVTAALQKGFMVSGHNVTIDGGQLRTSDVAFIVVQTLNGSQLSGFTFTGFTKTVLSIRTMQKGHVTDCHFVRNRMTDGLGIASFGFGRIRVLRCTFSENIVSNTSVLHAFTSMLYMEFCKIERNYVADGSGHPVVFLSNSVVDFWNVTVRHNSAADAALIRLGWRSFFNLYNCSIEENFNREIMLSDGVMSVLMFETNVTRNRGVLFQSKSTTGEIIFTDAVIESNRAVGRPLIEMRGGNVTIERSALIRENSATHFLYSHDSNTTVKLGEGHFHNNKLTKSMFSIDRLSVLEFSGTVFINNSMPDGLVCDDSIAVSMNGAEFIGNFGKIINCSDCQVSITSCSFISCNTAPLNITGSRNWRTWIVGSQFRGSVPDRSYIQHSGKSTMIANRFSDPKLTSLSSEQQRSCWFCEFNQKEEGCYSASVTAITIVFIIVCSVYGAYMTSDHFRLFWVLVRSPDQ